MRRTRARKRQQNQARHRALAREHMKWYGLSKSDRSRVEREETQWGNPRSRRNPGTFSSSYLADLVDCYLGGGTMPRTDLVHVPKGDEDALAAEINVAVGFKSNETLLRRAIYNAPKTKSGVMAAIKHVLANADIRTNPQRRNPGIKTGNGYTITSYIGDSGSYRGERLYHVKFTAGPMAGGSGNDSHLGDLKAWIRRMGYDVPVIQRRNPFLRVGKRDVWVARYKDARSLRTSRSAWPITMTSARRNPGTPRVTLRVARDDGQAYARDAGQFPKGLLDSGAYGFMPPWYARLKHKGEPLFEAFWKAHEFEANNMREYGQSVYW